MADQPPNRLARPIGLFRRGHCFAVARTPPGMPESLAFEFYLMRLEIEHIMNLVKQKICHRRALWS